MQTTLPVHGFVLAGGQSLRMGEDKALLRFCGRPMIEIAAEKLRSFCAEVGVAGNRDDLGAYAAVVRETRMGIGPASGVEAGLLAARLPWALFVPVDVPLIPQQVLREWAEAVVFAKEEAAVCASYLTLEEQPQPAFCLLRRECLEGWSAALEGGERRLLLLLQRMRVEGSGAVSPFRVERLIVRVDRERTLGRWWFCNVNTPEELAQAEAVAAGDLGGRASERASKKESE